jgi:uncharacterized C2H2 Zn-finger protein
MPKQFHFNLNDETAKTLEELSKTLNLTYTQVVQEAISHYVSCKVKTKEEQEEISLKPIITKYDGYCVKCNRLIPMGSEALYGKDRDGKTILICPVCNAKSGFSEADAKIYLKLFKYKRIVKGLKDMADKLCEQIENLDMIHKFYEFYAKADKYTELILNYLRTPIPNDEERKRFEETLRFINDLKALMKDYEAFIISTTQKRKRKNIEQKEKIPYES